MKKETPLAAAALQDLALFVEVARALSFTRASAAANVSVATLSRRIAALERSVGVQLFYRTARGLSLTEAGQAHFERCELIVQQAGVAYQMLARRTEMVRGLLRVSTPVEFGLIYVASVIEEFGRMHPEVRVEIELSPMRSHISAGEADVAIRIGPLPDQSVLARPLGHIALYFYASPIYLRTYGEPAGPDEMLKHQSILAGQTAQPSVWNIWNGQITKQIPVQGRFSANNVTMATRLAVAGYGIAALQPLIVREALTSGALRRVLPSWGLQPIPVQVVTASRLAPASVRAFIALLVERVAPLLANNADE